MSTTTFARWIQRLRSSILVTGFLLTLLVGVGPLQTLSLQPPQVQAQEVGICVEGEAEPTRIVQDCDFRGAGFAGLESSVVDALLALHQLPNTDANRIRAWERDAVRALMFTELMEMVQKEPAERTLLEQNMVDAMTDLVRQRRVDAAQYSLDQYDLWATNPCTYQAPHDFVYEVDLGWCTLPLVQLFDHPDAPTAEDFLNYGFAEINQEFRDDQPGALIAGETARNIGIIAGALAVVVSAWIGGVIGSVVTATGVVVAIHPALAAIVAVAVNSPAIYSTVHGATAAFVGALSIGALVGIIAFATSVLVLQAISVIQTTEIPIQLQEALDQAQAGVDLRQLAQSDEGTTEIYSAFLVQTLPDFPNSGTVPTVQLTDPTFVVTDSQGNKSHSQTINYQCWNPRDCAGTDFEHTSRLHEGWFVDTSDTTGAERMTVDIDYINWDDEAWTATRIGPHEFLHTRTGDENADPFVSTEIKYVDPSGEQFIAALNQPPATPPTPVPDDTVNNGIFQLDWAPGVTDADGDPVTYTLYRCDETETIGEDGPQPCAESLVATGLTTTGYTFTEDAPEEAGELKYRVVASDGEFEGESSPWSEIVQIDQRPPDITFVSRTPEANGAGWNNTDVTVEWSCADTAGIGEEPSGVISETVSETVTTEGENQSVTGVCEDHAGNTAAHTVGSISIDKTAPSVDIGGPYSIEEGSSLEFSSASANASDALSGIVSTAFAFDGDNQFDDGNPATFVGIDGPSEHQIRLRVEDRAGNVVIAGTTLFVTNATPSVSPPVIDIEPSDEGQSVVASATFDDPGSTDTHTCTVDYGNGPQPGTIDGNTCTGPSHTYADDDPSGTASDEYTIEVVVTDSDGNSGDSSGAHTVNNVAPVIDEITTNGPVAQGQPAQISVAASDIGVNDVLSYRFDCDGDGTFEVGFQAHSETTCSLDPSAALTTINVEVSDDDGGVTLGSVDVGQTLTLCLNYWTGALSPATASGGCPTNTAPQVLPSSNPTTLCLNPYTGGIRWMSNGSCPAGQMTHVVPDSGPLFFCQNIYTSDLRYSWSGACTATERQGVIPG